MSRDDRDDPPSTPSEELADPTGPFAAYSPNDLVKTTVAAAMLGLSVDQLRHWVQRDLVPVDHTTKQGHRVFRVRDLQRVYRRMERRRARFGKRRRQGHHTRRHHGHDDGAVHAEVFRLLRDGKTETDIVILLQQPTDRVRRIARAYRDAQRPAPDEETMRALNDALTLRGYAALESAEPGVLYRVIQSVLKDVDDYRHQLDDARQALSRAAQIPERLVALERELGEVRAHARRQLADKQAALNRAEVAVGTMEELNRRLVEEVVRLRGEDGDGPSLVEQAAACTAGEDGEREED